MDFEVLPDNWPVVKLFLTAQTQWRAAPMGGVIGLDYTAVEIAARLSNQTLTNDSFEGLRVMEMAAVAVLNKPSNE